MNKQTSITMNNYRITEAKIFSDSLILGFIQPFIPPTIRSSVHLFIRSSIHPFIRSSVHSFIRSSVHPFIRSSVHPFIHSFVHSFIRSSVHSFIRSFVRSFVHVCSGSEANTKKSNIIVFSGNGQGKFQISRMKQIVGKQT